MRPFLLIPLVSLGFGCTPEEPRYLARQGIVELLLRQARYRVTVKVTASVVDSPPSWA